MSRVIRVVVHVACTLVITMVWFDYEGLPKETIPQPYMEITVLDIGQGDAMLVSIPSHKHPNALRILIDTGKDSRIFQEIDSVLPRNDRSIDVLVLTHDDTDHIGMASLVIDKYDIKYSVDPGFRRGNDDDSDAYLAWLQDNATIKRIQIHKSKSLKIGGMVRIVSQDFEKRDAKKANDQSLLAYLYTKTGFEMIATADASIPHEEAFAQWIISQYGEAMVDVIKVGHHGSAHSTSKKFLNITRPSIALISAGAKNPYRHPSVAVLDRLQDMHIKYLCTCRGGRIHLMVYQDETYIQHDNKSYRLKHTKKVSTYHEEEM